LLTGSGCTSTQLFVVNTLARFDDYTLHQDIHYGDTINQRLDIYLPSNIEKSNLATVVFFYGGCWGACSELTKENYRFVAQTLTKNNIIAVIIDYRKFPDVLFPEIIEDAKRSVDWVSENIASYGGNNQNIFLMGHSSGAHLASMLNFNENYLMPDTYQKIKGFIGLAGPYDFLPFTEPYQPALFSPPEAYAESQTINFVDGNEPPSLLLYGNNDTRVKRYNILSLKNEIESREGMVETQYYDGIDHAGIIGSLTIPLRASQPVMKDILRFISRILSSQV